MHAQEHAKILYQKGKGLGLHTIFHIYWFWEFGFDVFRAFPLLMHLRYLVLLHL